MTLPDPAAAGSAPGAGGGSVPGAGSVPAGSVPADSVPGAGSGPGGSVSGGSVPGAERPPRPGDPAAPASHPVGDARGPAIPESGGAVRLTAWVRGRVQGVGFRWWTRCRALELGLTGRATNLDDGRVEVVAEGPRDACERLLAALRGGGTPGRVVSVTERWSDPKGGMTGFVER